VYDDAGKLVAFEPAKTTVDALARKIRGEKTAEVNAMLEEIREKVVASNLRSAKAILKKVHKVETRNENAANVMAFHAAMLKGNAGDDIVAKLTGMQEVIKAGKKTMKAAKVGDELKALRNAGLGFNNKYKATAEDRAMLKFLESSKTAKVAAAREHFADALAARQAKLAAKTKEAAAEVVLSANALASATSALGVARGGKKVDPKNAERYARILALATGSGLDIKPEHYYGIFREAFKTRRAKKGEKSTKAGAGGAGAGAGLASALLARVSSSSSGSSSSRKSGKTRKAAGAGKGFNVGNSD
jgi:hypothetical protein